MSAAMPEEGYESPLSPGSLSSTPPPPESPNSPLGGPPSFDTPRPFGAPSADAGGRGKRKSSRRPATSGVVLEDKSLGVKRASVATGTGAAAAVGAASLGLGGRAATMSYVDGVRGIFKGMGIPGAASAIESMAVGEPGG